jgi:hypothetical protein
MLAGVDSLKFSFNFANAAQFHDVTGVKPGSFRTIL